MNVDKGARVYVAGHRGLTASTSWRRNSRIGLDEIVSNRSIHQCFVDWLRGLGHAKWLVRVLCHARGVLTWFYISCPVVSSSTAVSTGLGRVPIARRSKTSTNWSN